MSDPVRNLNYKKLNDLIEEVDNKGLSDEKEFLKI